MLLILIFFSRTRNLQTEEIQQIPRGCIENGIGYQERRSLWIGLFSEVPVGRKMIFGPNFVAWLLSKNYGLPIKWEFGKCDNTFKGEVLPLF